MRELHHSRAETRDHVGKQVLLDWIRWQPFEYRQEAQGCCFGPLRRAPEKGNHHLSLTLNSSFQKNLLSPKTDIKKHIYFSTLNEFNFLNRRQPYIYEIFIIWGCFNPLNASNFPRYLRVSLGTSFQGGKS